MALSNASESDLLKLLFLNTAWANVGSVAGLQPSSSAGSFYVNLHTASSGAAGNQGTNEAAYTGYARVAIARSGAGFVLSGSAPTASKNVAAATFPQSSSGPEVETDFSIGVSGTAHDTGESLWFGPLTASLTVNNLITPSFAALALQLTMS